MEITETAEENKNIYFPLLLNIVYTTVQSFQKNANFDINSEGV